MMVRWFLAMCMLVSSVTAMATDLCPRSGPAVEWAAACFDWRGADRRVKPQYLKRLRLDRHGFATVMIGQPRELVAVNRQGKVVVPGIAHTGDFDYPNANLGIGRFSNRAKGAQAARCGYFLSRGFSILVPAEYDHCQPFADGEAIACKGCQSVCTEPECQNHVLTGGEAVVLGPDATVRRRFSLPPTGSACSSGKSPHPAPADGEHPLARCANPPDNPFNQLD